MRNTMKKRMLALAGAVLFGFSTVVGQNPLKAEAKTEEPIQVGDGVYANLDDVGTLTISGTGDMWANVKMNDKDIFEYLQSVWPDAWVKKGDPIPWFQLYKDSIDKVIFGDGVTSVGKQAFCVRKTLDIRNSDYRLYDGGTGVPSITSVTLSSTIKTIEEEAFRAMPALTKINIPGNVEEIKAYAFKDSALNKVTLNEGLKTISSYAFEGTKLTGVNIPGTVATIEPNIFYNSTLQTVTINKGTKLIKKDAFGNVSARIYSKDVVILEGAFGEEATFVCYKGSTADKYAKRHKIKVTKYISDKPDKAKAPKVTSKNGKLIVNCKNLAGTDGYEIRYSENSDMKAAEIEEGKRVTIARLKKGTKYYVQARGYKNTNSGKVYGDWSNKVSVTIK